MTQWGVLQSKLYCTYNEDSRGIKTVTFAIGDTDLSKVSMDPISCVYSASAQTPKPQLSLKETAVYNLIEGKDYTIDGYQNNTNVGTASIVVKGCGAFTGTSHTFTFTIKPADISKASISQIADEVYNGKEHRPTPRVLMPELPDAPELVMDQDYTLSYENNTNAGEAAIVITGKGNYDKNTHVRSTFLIKQAELNDCAISVSQKETYTGGKICPKVSVTLGDTTLPQENVTR